MEIELHPLRPFLPSGGRVLLLGSFPPPRKRWCMEFFYPNWTNDMWRIWGYIVAGDRDYFTVPGEKRFDRERIEQFCNRMGIALYDTAQEVVRLRDNASDNFLQVVRPTDVAALLEAMPQCHTVVATGQKSATVLQEVMHIDVPLAVGENRQVHYAGRQLAVWRMPSTSRAFPKPIEWKAEFYRKIIEL